MRFERRRSVARLVGGMSSVALGYLVGCASPGAPKPPSLQLPETVRDLAAVRSGDAVQLRFTLPSRTTDGLPLRGPELHGSLCRQLGPGKPCQAVDADSTAAALRLPAAGAQPTKVKWVDSLPVDLASGAPRALLYRVEIRNGAGKSAGYSEPVYAAAGAAPAPVGGLQLSAIRAGVFLRWAPASSAGEVLLERTQVDPPPAVEHTRQAKSVAASRTAGRTSPALPRTATAQSAPAAGVTWLQAAPGNGNAGETIDGTVDDGFRYSYVAVRRTAVQIGARSLELRSAPSPASEITWRDVYPPPMPQGLTALGYAVPPSDPGKPGGFAVDLVWQPVNDPRVTGYRVRRTQLDASGNPIAGQEAITSPLVPAPAFHDATALASTAYRYEVCAVDAKGKVSPPAVATVAASAP